MKIGITADCSSGLEYFPHKHNILITRTAIHFNEKTLIDGVDISADEFYEKLYNTNIVPTTSAPSIKEVVRTIDELKEKGCTDIIHFPIANALSAYGENLKNIIDDLSLDINYHVFNSRSSTILQGYIAYYAEKLVEAGYDIPTIFKEANKIRDNTRAYFVVDDLKYLVKNGRLSTTAGFIGNLANVKPILELSDTGKIVTFEKVRTHRRAVKRMLDLIKSESTSYKKVLYLVLHTRRHDDALEIATELKENTNNIHRIEVSTITPTVGAHIGCGVLGIARIVLDNLLIEI